MRFALLLLGSLLFGGWRESNISAIDKIISTYEARLHCLQNKEAIPCIEEYPLHPKSDALAKTFCMSFPKSYYKATLKRDIKLLQKQKLCYGRAPSQEKARQCLKP